MCLSFVYMNKCRYLRMTKESVVFGAAVIGSCEPPHVGTGTKLRSLENSISKLLSHPAQ